MNSDTNEALKVAKAAYESGNIDQAEMMCREMIGMLPDDGEVLYLMAQVQARRGNSGEARDYLKRSIALVPDDPIRRHDLAQVLTKLGELANAEETLRELLKRAPYRAEAHHHLGFLLERRGRRKEAIGALRRALELEPRMTGAHQMLGALLYQDGVLAEALPHLWAARRAAPPGADPYQLLPLTLLALGRQEELFGLQSAQAANSLQRFNEEVVKAIAAFERGDDAACKRHLESADGFHPENSDKPGPNQRVFETYRTYLRGLLAYREEHRDLYGGDAAGEIHLLGDSHSLATAQLVVPFRGTPHRIAPRLVFGCKAFHLSREKPNQFKSSLQAIASGIPEGAIVFAMFGEIDLRLGEGLLPVLKKNPLVTVEQATSEVVEGYLDCVGALAQKRQFRLHLISPPASNFDFSVVPESDRKLHGEITRSFLDQLRGQAEHRELPLLDLHTMTTDGEGRTRAEYYIDSNHVRPAAFIDAFRATAF